jgi:heparin/heparan-sulfate lyase
MRYNNFMKPILIILLSFFFTWSSSYATENNDQLAYKIKDNHPRLYITPEFLGELKKKAEDKDPTWHRLLRYLEGGRFYDPMRLIKSYGIAYLVTGDESYAREGIDKAMGYVKGGRIKGLNKAGAIEGVAIAYDWFYDLLDESQKKQIIKWLNDSCDQFKSRYVTAWHNYAPSLLISIGSTGYATYGDNPRAAEWIDNAYKKRFKTILNGLQISGAGGGWPESTAYGTNSVYRLLRFCEIVKTATGLDLYESTPFFRDRMYYSIHMHYPGLFTKYKQPYHEFIRLGDGIRGLKGYQAYERGAQQLLARRFTGDQAAAQLQYLLNERTVNYAPFSWMAVEDFMYADTVSMGTEPRDLHHFSEGSGTVFMRSDWKDSATWASFQCGDHFEYHQHLDQNSFTIYKYNDLAIDSGNYDGYGGSDHGINYYKRTVAHNSILVYDPIEGFSKIVGGKKGMPDGGQRTMNPHSIQVLSAEKWYENRDAFIYSVTPQTPTIIPGLPIQVRIQKSPALHGSSSICAPIYSLSMTG